MKVRYTGKTTKQGEDGRLVHDKCYEVKSIERNFKGEIAFYRLITFGNHSIVAFENEVEGVNDD